MLLSIWVPKPGAQSYAVTRILPGSAIVSRFNDHAERVDFEGRVNAAQYRPSEFGLDPSFELKIYLAASRNVSNYPTVACMHLDSETMRDNLIYAGSLEWNIQLHMITALHIHEQKNLEQWLEHATHTQQV